MGSVNPTNILFHNKTFFFLLFCWHLVHIVGNANFQRTNLKLHKSVIRKSLYIVNEIENPQDKYIICHLSFAAAGALSLFSMSTFNASNVSQEEKSKFCATKEIVFIANPKCSKSEVLKLGPIDPLGSADEL